MNINDLAKVQLGQNGSIYHAGMTIYGKWSQIILDSGSIIAYIG
jgi:hypothetical protein